MNNRQRWLGSVVLLSGGVLLAALLLKGREEIHDMQQAQNPPVKQAQQQNKAPAGEAVQLQPLTVDVATEKRLLEEQKRSRERAVAEQEAKTAEFLRMQQQAEADAARKAAEEYAAMNARRGGAQESSDNIPPELVQDEKAKVQQKSPEQQKSPQQKQDIQKQDQLKQDQQKADAEQKLAEQKRQRAEAEKKAAEDKRRTEEAAKKKAADQAAADKAAADKKKADADKAAAEARKAEETKKAEEAERKAAEDKKRKAQDEARKKAEADKARELLEGGDRGNKQWMVQVALAANEANADALASKLRAKGYKVTRSPTSKGIRIMVGPAKDRDTADATRKKINTDESLGMKSAWVIDWTPLEQR